MTTDKLRWATYKRWIQILVSVSVPLLFSLLFLLYAPRVPLARAGPSHDVSIDIDEHGFTPAVITIAVGTKVVWENTSDTAFHTVAIDGLPPSQVLRPGDKYSYQFDALGDYPYHCVTHPNEQGVIHVIAQPLEPAELSVTSSRDQPITPNAVVDYHILYENHSDSTTAQNTVLTVTLPSGVSLLTSTRRDIPLPPTSHVEQTLVYALGAVPPDTEAQLDLQVRMPAVLPSSSEVRLIAVITADNADTEAEDNYTEDSSEVARPRLTVGIRPADESAAFSAGRVVTYTLEYANRSDEVAATSVTVTLQLPAVATFVDAHYDDDAGGTSIPNTSVGSVVSLFLGTLGPERSGRIHAQLRLSDTLVPGQPISMTARIASATPVGSAEPEDEDSVSSDLQVVQTDAPNLYVRLSSSGDSEIGGQRLYQVFFGNAGGREATNVQVSLILPGGVTDADFGAIQPTSFVNQTAVWRLGTLDDRTVGRPFNVRTTIRDAGELTATATITGTSETPEVEASDNEAVEVEYVIPLTRPTIYTPKGAIVGPRPVFRGLGTPGALVTITLAASASVPTHTVGSAVVGPDRAWTITPSAPITDAGWHWATARQTLGGRTSGMGGTSFVVNTAPRIDPESVTREGIPLGGLNPTLGWAPNRVYRLGMTILACDAPISPTLHASLYNAAGLMTGYRDYPGTQASDPRHVEFNFLTPISTLAFELHIQYECPSSSTPSGRIHIEDCFEGLSCSDDPPEPPPGCEDCVPGRPPRPRAIDPDGFIYDAAAVRAGATITQSIITQAWVTATRQTAPGVFTPWNALEYGQVNPQFSDSLYPDKVLVPGYYSFRVPPGSYRLSVTVPGFLPYESPVVQVIALPVTLHLPLERSNGTVRDVEIQAPIRLFLPMIRRAGASP